MGGSLSNFEEMPQPTAISPEEKLSRTFAEELFSKEDQRQIVSENEPKLNKSQTSMVEEVYQAVHGNNIVKSFVVNSPGGYGKTFAFTVLAAKLRCEGKIVLNVASTGLAAQNLQGGRTAHSRFKIPIPIHEDSTCGIKAQSDLAKLIKETSLIIWDEVFSSDRFNVEAVERSLKDIMENEDDFGGKVVCVSGDPRQTLPVVKKAGRAKTVKACFQMSPLYHKMKLIPLTENMRTDPDEVEFSNYLLRLGEGREEVIKELNDFAIKIPDEYIVKTKEDLIEKVFPNLNSSIKKHKLLIDGAIYTPLNADVKDVNDICMKQLPGKSKTYLSADSILEHDHQEAIPTEYLNSLSVSGLPDHKLELKIGAPVMLLRNLQGGQSNSLRNGTRMIIVNMMDRCLECEVATGSMRGLRVYLPRIPHHDSTGDFPFTIVRRQFPVRPAFCITINKVS
jgi:ATP-dependent DNA helicase PIF1